MLAINQKKSARVPIERDEQDIIVNKVSYVTVYENGNEVRKRQIKKVNITRLVNESQKLIKTTQAKEKAVIAELEKYFTK